MVFLSGCSAAGSTETQAGMDGWNNGNRASLIKGHKQGFKATVPVGVAISFLSVQAISDALLEEFKFRIYSEVWDWYSCVMFYWRQTGGELNCLNLIKRWLDNQSRKFDQLVKSKINGNKKAIRKFFCFSKTARVTSKGKCVNYLSIRVVGSFTFTWLVKFIQIV